MSTESIETELSKTAARIGELQIMQAEIEANLQKSQSGFINGTAALDAMQADQNRLSGLKNSLSELEKTRTSLEAKLDQAKQSAQRAAKLEALKTLAHGAAQNFSDYNFIRRALNATIKTEVGKLLDNIAEFWQRKNEFKRLFEQIAPASSVGVSPLAALWTESRQPSPGFDFSPEKENKIAGLLRDLEKLGVDGETIKLLTGDHISEEDLDFGGLIEMAKVEESNARYQERERGNSKTVAQK